MCLTVSVIGLNHFSGVQKRGKSAVGDTYFKHTQRMCVLVRAYIMCVGASYLLLFACSLYNVSVSFEPFSVQRT